ncbi:MAG TPA: hypothetical protein VE265_15560 [Actinomycetota bacterium]|nr:hypothetical protein [Actinomycetota bacterium]
MASAAASIGWVRPWVLAPSDSSSTTSGASSAPPCSAGGLGDGRAELPEEGGVGGRLTSRARSIPSPMAVAPSACSESIAPYTATRSVVGRVRVWAVEANETIPTRNFSGRSSTKAVAARWDDSRRVGSTSVAFIDPDTSMTRMIVACSLGTRASAWGLARLTSRAARASR